MIVAIRRECAYNWKYDLNISQFVKLIVKECINRIPVRVWSLNFERNDYHLVLIFAWIYEVWIECMKLRIMKAMFDCDSHLAK